MDDVANDICQVLPVVKPRALLVTPACQPGWGKLITIASILAKSTKGTAPRQMASTLRRTVAPSLKLMFARPLA